LAGRPTEQKAAAAGRGLQGTEASIPELMVSEQISEIASATYQMNECGPPFIQLREEEAGSTSPLLLRLLQGTCLAKLNFASLSLAQAEY
jgi:hypothetical protein